MKNKKLKGFTLIELIVVIAIIGILAAILTMSILGYLRNARVAQANANAKQVHTAVSAGLSQMAIAREPLSTTSISFTDDPTGQCTLDGFDLELEIYLGHDFRGTGYAEFTNVETYSIDFATWVVESSPHTTWETELQQKMDARNNIIYGVFPFAP